MRWRVALAALGIVLASGAATAMAKTPLRGVVEGYYGRPWSGDARRDVIRFCGARNLRTFVYGPKNDPYHRDRWRELYPDAELDDLRATVRVAREAKVRFVWAISPALDVCYTCPDDRRALRAKLRQLARAGVRRFAIFFDDVPEGLTAEGDIARFGGSDGAAVARAHAYLTNGIDRWLRRRGLPGLVFMVPTDYDGTDCSPYHEELGRRLRRRLPIGWTGSGVFAETITLAEVAGRIACLGGHPIVLWDNFPVNDAVLANSLHIGPFNGRGADIANVLAGHLLNPMTQAHASLVALGAAARYFAAPKTYDAEIAWRESLAELDPSGALTVLAEQTRSSALTPGFPDAFAWTAAVDAIDAAFDGPDWSAGVAALDEEAARQRAAATQLQSTPPASQLHVEIAPWALEMEQHARVAGEVVTLLRAMKPSVVDVTATPDAGALRIVGRALPPDPTRVAALAAALPTIADADFSGYVRCLAPLTGAERGFCPEFGLNVHGKRLYFLAWSLTRLELTTGRNQYDRLVTLALARHTAWVARQGAGTGLTATIDGTPLPLDGDGRFDVTVPFTSGGTVRLEVVTAAGDATGITLP